MSCYLRIPSIIATFYVAAVSTADEMSAHNQFYQTNELMQL